MAVFAICDHAAGDILSARLAEADFLDRMTQRSVTWQLDFPVFMQQTQTVVAIALLNAYADAELPTATEAASAALTVLRERNVAELFAALPTATSEADPEIKRLKLISIGLTARSSLLWERLAETARNVLDPDAQYG